MVLKIFAIIIIYFSFEPLPVICPTFSNAFARNENRSLEFLGREQSLIGW